MFCRNCGKELIGTPEICVGCGARPLAGNSFCHACGAETNPLAEICMKCGARLAKAAAVDISPKSRLAVTLLTCLIGVLGAHRFYLGKIRTAVGMLALSVLFCVFYILGLALGYPVEDLLSLLSMLCMAAVGIWALIDFIFAITGKMKDKEGKLIKNW